MSSSPHICAFSTTTSLSDRQNVRAKKAAGKYADTKQSNVTRPGAIKFDKKWSPLNHNTALIEYRNAVNQVKSIDRVRHQKERALLDSLAALTPEQLPLDPTHPILECLKKEIQQLQARLYIERCCYPSPGPPNLDRLQKKIGKRLPKDISRDLWYKGRGDVLLVRRKLLDGRKVAQHRALKIEELTITENSFKAHLKRVESKGRDEDLEVEIVKLMHKRIWRLTTVKTEPEEWKWDEPLQPPQEPRIKFWSEGDELNRVGSVDTGSVNDSVSTSQSPHRQLTDYKFSIDKPNASLKLSHLIPSLNDPPAEKTSLKKSLMIENIQSKPLPSSQVYINPTLTIDFDAPVPTLQANMKAMRKLVEGHFPFNVEHSSNQQTLQAWLRILVRRWQQKQVAGELGKRLDAWDGTEMRAVLDEMMKEHGLDVVAADRMARRWEETVKRKQESERRSKAENSQRESDSIFRFVRSKKESVADGDGDESRQVVAESKLARQAMRTPVYSKISTRGFSTSSRRLTQKPPTSPTSDQEPAPTPSTLPHLTSTGSAHMVSVSSKPHTLRTAIATGKITFSNPTPLSLIRSNKLKKGDVLSVSRIAGIMATKKCPEIIPLCHPIMLTHVGLELVVFGGEGEEGGQGHGGVTVEAKVQCEGQTGVEMEALTGVMGAALSVVDMCKAVDKGMVVGDVRVVLKEGGRSGVWKEEGWVSKAGMD